MRNIFSGKKLVVLAVLIITAGLDRWLKQIAENGETAKLGPLHFHLFPNTGAIFSIPLPSSLTIVLMCAAIVVMLLGIVLYRRRWSWVQFSAMLFVVVGALSNVWDRWRYGYVIDWADFGRWLPIVNIADLMILFGVLIFIWRAPIDKSNVRA